MIIRKFEGKTEEEATLLAKKELGENVIIMNVKEIKPKGIFKIFKHSSFEVTGAIDDTNIQIQNKLESISSYDNNNQQNMFNNMIKQQQPLQPVKTLQSQSNSIEEIFRARENANSAFLSKNNNSRQNSYINEFSKSKTEVDTSVIEQKLNTLTSLMEKQLQQQKVEQKSKNITLENKKELELETTVEFAKMIYNKLIDNEVDEKFANQLVTEIETSFGNSDTIDNILAVVYQKIILKIGQPSLIELSDKKPKTVFFIGPTGVGKTTTIAKIASMFKMDKNAKVALLTADTYRIAAVEQLRTYANILSVPIKVVYTAEEIENAIREFKDYDLILVDTAGRSHKNDEQAKDLNNLINGVNIKEKEVYLVVSASTKYKDLIKITETYSNIANCKVIFTKLDETSCLGNILNVKMLTNLPLSYATFGQNVPDDIEGVDAQMVAKQLLGGNE